MPRRNTHTINWTVILFLAGLAITTMTTLGAFYWGTNATLAKHEEQFKKLGEEFKGFGETSKSNFERWLAINKQEQDKLEKQAKEDREAREKMRENFTTVFSQMGVNMAATKVQSDMIAKQLDEVKNELRGISSVQQENRLIRSQGKR